MSIKESIRIHSNLKSSLESAIDSFNTRTGAKFKLVEDINDTKAKYDLRIVDNENVTVSSSTVYGGKKLEGIIHAYNTFLQGPHIKFLYHDKIPTNYATR